MTIPNNLKNWISDLALLFGTYFFYTRLPYFKNYFRGEHDIFFVFTTFDFFFWLLVGLVLSLTFFRIFERKVFKSKSRIFFEVLTNPLLYFLKSKKKKITKEEWTAFFSIIVRLFYFPLMSNWCLSHLSQLLVYSVSLKFFLQIESSDFAEFFNKYFFWFVFNLILFLDTLIFASSYLLESKFLKNKIRSVEPTLFGWGVALACYPPFNQITGQFLKWETADSVSGFSNQNLNLFFNILILISFFVYVWASVSLGFKAGNLVNRGIVSSGAYKFVRHPAYISKNFAWWLGSLPFFFSAWQVGWEKAFLVLTNVAFWSLIYYFRAITEENHLLSDPDYRKYVKKVKWRFVPKVF